MKKAEMGNRVMEHTAQIPQGVQKRSKNFFLYFSIAVFVLTVIRLVLGLIVPISLLTNQEHDDALLFRYAENLIDFNWLGEYDSKTLVKGASYPLFIALCHWLHIPYTLGYGLFNVGSAFLFITALKKRFPNKIPLYCIYLLLIYAPYTFSSAVGLRAYRMAIVPFTVLLVFGCIIGLYLRKEQSPKSLIPWSVGAGISLGYFWFIREDSIWILPFTAVVLIILAVCVIKEKSAILTKIKKLILTVVPVVGILVAILSVCILNYHYYGVFTTNDRSSGEFGKMMGYLYSVEDENAPANVWVSHDVLEEAMEVSPTLNSIREEIETYYNAWGGGGAIKGDIIAWSLRDAATEAGYYQNAAETEAFYAQVNQELEQAFQDGRLQEDDTIRFSDSTEGIRLEQIPNMLYQSIKQTVKMSLFYDTEPAVPYSIGTPSNIERAEVLTRTTALWPATYNITINGTFISKTGEDLSMEIIGQNGETLQNVAFQSQQEDSCSFSSSFYHLTGNQLQVRIFQNGELIDSFALESRSTDQFDLQIETAEQVVFDARADQAAGDISILNNIQNAYSTLAPIVNVLALIGYLLEIACLFFLKKKKQPVWPEMERWLVVTGLGLSALVLIFGVEFFCSWMDDGWVLSFYSCGAYTLLMLVKYLSIYLGVQSVLYFFKCRKSKQPKAKLQKRMVKNQ